MKKMIMETLVVAALAAAGQAQAAPIALGNTVAITATITAESKSVFLAV